MTQKFFRQNKEAQLTFKMMLVATPFSFERVQQTNHTPPPLTPTTETPVWCVFKS